MAATSMANEDNSTLHNLPAHLSGETQVHVIISTLSGTQQAQSYYDKTLSPFLAEHDIKYTKHTTESTQTIIELVRDVFAPQAHRGIPQTVMLLSGDGGIVDIVNTLASSLPEPLNQGLPTNYIKPTICLIPHGSGNALAWSSRVAKEPLKTILHGQPKPVPIFHATFSPGTKLVVNEGSDLKDIPDLNPNGHPNLHGAVVFSWGLHASLVARSDTKEYRKHGTARFGMAARELLELNHGYKGKISIRPQNSRTWHELPDPTKPLNQPQPTSNNPTSTPSHDTFNEPEAQLQTDSEPTQSSKLSYLAATVVSNLEEKYCISPSHEPLSDEMHVIYIPHFPASELAELTFLPYEQGRHVRDPRVTYLAIDSLRIEIDEDADADADEMWRDICVDGKIVRLEVNGWAEVSRIKGVSVVDIVANS